MNTNYKIRVTAYQCHAYQCELINADGKQIRTVALAEQELHKLERSGVKVIREGTKNG